ncbi:hypothetical protein [Aureivirga marina]|uniref:hypothetical protein n=1 Tax=Aureivirga marina TaxID=1182451 RepID=UPI0018C96A6D|nr:hypothetical protein [Aureivirga marina]
MKTLRNLALAFSAMAFAISCSSDDDSTEISTQNHFPLGASNYWKYDATMTGAEPAQDSLYVNSVQNNIYDLNVKDVSTNLFMGVITQNNIKVENGEYYLQGSVNVGDVVGNILDLEIDLNNAKFLSENAAANTQLFYLEGEEEQNFGQIPLKLKYNVETIQQELMSSKNVNGETYENVIKVQFKVNLQIQAEVLVSFDLMAPQDVIVVDAYFAEGIGMIESNTTMQYELENLSLIGGLNFPETMSQTQDEEITEYLVIQ